MNTPAQNFDGIILGAGAAGLMCAIEAGKRGRRIALLERADRIGKKILISGGGRCNFTNLHCRPEKFLSANPHFAKSPLARYTPTDFIALVEKHHIPYHEKTLGQLFCDRSARDIVAMLEEECRGAQVSIFLNTKIEKVSAGFTVNTTEAEFHAPKLVVASGGLSIPKIGATSFGYEIARQFDVKIREPWPALVPLVFTGGDKKLYSDLAGVSTEIFASCRDGAQESPHFREKMLFTHRGLSGPAILQASSYWEKSQPLVIDLAPDAEVTLTFRDAKKQRSPEALKSELRKFLPNRLADRWLDLHPPTAWTNTGLADWERQLHAWTIAPAGTEGYEKAEVTAGGVDTDELSAKTMESKKAPGLYFIGEVVDVTGHLGGFNFQWAWSSGAAAGRAL
jgi:predicted Rossmann fold flavoprotein